MYPKEYFLERFKEVETSELLHRLANEDLADEAKEAITQLLASRGVDTSGLGAQLLQARKAAHRRTRGTHECDYCGSSARFSAVLDQGQRFCSKLCLRDARLMEISEDIPAEAILLRARAIKSGPCPTCGQCHTRTEVRKYYRVWSVGVFTQWTNRSQVCCHSCARKDNAWSILFSAAFGWWGIPWGLIMTPSQIAANLAEFFRAKGDPEPSDELVHAARLELAIARYKKLAAGDALYLSKDSQSD